MNLKIFLLSLFVPSIMFLMEKEGSDFEFDEHQSALISPDTLFVSNEEEGWTTMSSYLQNQGDSVIFELILSRNIPAQNDWYRPTLIGTISANYAPAMHTTLEYKAPTRTWLINVIPDGKCFLTLKAGSLPNADPCIVAFQTKYKQ